MFISPIDRYSSIQDKQCGQSRGLGGISVKFLKQEM